MTGVKAVRCPVCGGSGQYTGDWDPNVTGCPESRTCHGCNGKGWVEVIDYICHPCEIKEGDATGVLTVSDAGPYWGNFTVDRRKEYYPFLEP